MFKKNEDDNIEDLFLDSPKTLIRRFWIMIGFAISVFLIIVLITYLLAN